MPICFETLFLFASLQTWATSAYSLAGIPQGAFAITRYLVLIAVSRLSLTFFPGYSSQVIMQFAMLSCWLTYRSI